MATVHYPLGRGESSTSVLDRTNVVGKMTADAPIWDPPAVFVTNGLPPRSWYGPAQAAPPGNGRAGLRGYLRMLLRCASTASSPSPPKARHTNSAVSGVDPPSWLPSLVSQG